jgi:hypothetical protein
MLSDACGTERGDIILYIDNFLFIFIFRILCCDLQNITFYSEYRCNILYQAFASCLEREKNDVIIDV